MSFGVLAFIFGKLFLLYTDPGSGALLLQLLAATLLGGLFYIRKAKDKILRLFFKRSTEADKTSLQPGKPR